MSNAGKNLQTVRKRRGLSQRELADASGVSLSAIRKLEQGERPSARMETWRKLASTLKVPTMSLATPDTEGADGETVDRWEQVRKALDAPVGLTAEQDEPPTVDGVRESVDALTPLFRADQFGKLAVALPQIIRDADALGPAGRPVRVKLLQLTGWLLTQTRQFEAAQSALERSMDDVSDRLEATETANNLCWLLLRMGKLGEARELAIKWADDMEPRRITKATPTELCLWGWMLLRVSAAAVRDSRPGEAEDAMKFAHAASIALGREYAPPEHSLRTFGPLTVLLKRGENAAVSDAPDKVLKFASLVPRKGKRGGVRPTSNNWNRHLLDVSHAHARTGQYGDAVAQLREIHAASPEWLPNQRFARDILNEVIAGRRTLTTEMRDLAEAVRLPL
ncbi:helix-turn-helix domain-containing protein [Streptomyces sp. HU2014]|uniref:helix-turn-helix domain-containing protein n=1 Tax=Streptomyces sp. HU2014 TaxID=2939414 RepID=UPI00200F9CDE|nr:helix-turn-helix transcriptional regulator [Streptomyces sp. HU2014]UQI48768.1 helix-turn-helix domain-containing protein [Streptomyces sp. HU2014]